MKTAGTTLALDSSFTLPIDRRQLGLALRLEGERLDHASALVGYTLPPIGPYRLATRVSLAPQEYRLSDLVLRMGSSELRGGGSFDTRGERPRLEVELASEVIQLDDFEARDAAVARGSAALGALASKAAAPAPAVPEAEEAPTRFLSPEGLLRLDARVAVRVDRVLSGEDVAGRGELVVALDDGRLRVDPFDLEAPGGSVALRGSYAYAGDQVNAHIQARTQRFDYGLLARRVDPTTDTEGWLSLDLDVAGTAPRTGDLLAHANGRLDFVAAPRSIAVDVFDLSAVGLLRVLLPRLDSGPKSRLNCIVARFDLADGVLRERSLLLDTTNTVVHGTATVDLQKRTVHAVLTPAPKKARLLSFQPRVQVTGRFSDFGRRVPPEELLAMLVRFGTGVVTTPLSRIFRGPLPADGEATCRAAWEQGEQAAAASSSLP